MRFSVCPVRRVQIFGCTGTGAAQHTNWVGSFGSTLRVSFFMVQDPHRLPSPSKIQPRIVRHQSERGASCLKRLVFQASAH